jgi:twitching motility protein PilT
MINCEEVILKAREMRVSDIHISSGLDMLFRINGALTVAPFDLTEDETHQMLMDTLDDKQRDYFEEGNDVDFAIQTCDGNRQRVNIFRQMGHSCATIRLLNNKIPSLEQLHLPQVIHELADKPRGMILVTGPTGSGKSTTLAAMIDHINTNRAEHIITIEDPVEYVYEKKKSLIHQREVGRDVTSFSAALRSALREDPDIILVGEMRDYETISAALTAAETGHLVMSTLHTNGAAQTVDRIIDACPAETQNQVRSQLGGILQGIITQTLIPNSAGNGRVPGTEILVGTDAALNLIRENKSFQLGTVMQSGANVGMHTLNSNLAELVYKGMITPENAFKYSNNRKDLEQFLGPMMF